MLKLNDIFLEQLLNRNRRCDVETPIRAMSGQRILITGAGGSIGSRLSELLARHHDGELLLIDRHDGALFQLEQRIKPDGQRVRMMLIDVTNFSDMYRTVRQFDPQLMIHTAAYKHVPMLENQSDAAWHNNVMGTLHALRSLTVRERGRFVFISTDKAVNPVNVMGKTKREAERLVLHPYLGTTTAVVRFGNVAGSSGSVIETWFNQLTNGEPITVTGADMERYFMLPDEAACLVLQSAAHKSSGRVHIPELPAPILMSDMAKRMVAMFGHGKILYGEPRPGERISESFVNDGEEPIIHQLQPSCTL